MTSVTAIRVQRTGGPEVLELDNVELSDLQPGQARIAVAAAGVNFIDIYRRQGVYPQDMPYTPGTEGSGLVLEVAPGVTNVVVGDRVAWESLPGSYAQQVVGAANRLIEVPDAVDDEQAAAFPLQGLTAHYLATSAYKLVSGDTVLIHAGAGGVGLILTQVAKILGARVITTASTAEKRALSLAAGADEVIEYDGFDTIVRELTYGHGVAAVYDGVGKDTFDRSLNSLRWRGTMVLFGGASGQVPPFELQRLAAGGSLTVTRPTLVHFVAEREELLNRSAQMLGWVAQGRIDLRIGERYALADASVAHADLAARRSTGKLLLIP